MKMPNMDMQALFEGRRAFTAAQWIDVLICSTGISFADAIDRYFKLGNDLNQRDTIAVRRTVSSLLKLLCPHIQIRSTRCSRLWVLGQSASEKRQPNSNRSALPSAQSQTG